MSSKPQSILKYLEGNCPSMKPFLLPLKDDDTSSAHHSKRCKAQKCAVGPQPGLVHEVEANPCHGGCCDAYKRYQNDHHVTRQIIQARLLIKVLHPAMPQ